jgi:hypothetical protein
MGLGNSAVGAPITHTAVAGMPREQAGAAAGVSHRPRRRRHPARRRPRAHPGNHPHTH